MVCSFFILFLLQLFSAHGVELSTFLEKYKNSIDKYVMAGYGDGWDSCDVVTDYYHERDFMETVPQLVMDLKKEEPSETNASSSGNSFI